MSDRRPDRIMELPAACFDFVTLRTKPTLDRLVLLRLTIPEGCKDAHFRFQVDDEQEEKGGE